jgi:uncharacterized membrane protein YwaF
VLTHYWGLVLSSRALLTPDIGTPEEDAPDFPHHLVVTVAVTSAFNTIAGTNYGYLSAKPPTASVLDLLGPWPLYLLVEIAVVIIVWVLMTWPWEPKRRHAMVSRAGAPG